VDAPVNLLGLPPRELEAWVLGLGSRPYRARQLQHWLYKRGVQRFDEMTDLAKDFRAQLALQASVKLPEIVLARQSADGTRKWLLRADASQAFEMVFIPEAGRGTLCISSQVGCVLDCSFCSTAQQGFNRNLAPLRSSVSPGSPTANSASSPVASGASPTSCSWAWASRSPIFATWCPRSVFSSTIPVSTCPAAASRSRPPDWCRRSTGWRR
jgi:hypothetical protein